MLFQGQRDQQSWISRSRQPDETNAVLIQSRSLDLKLQERGPNTKLDAACANPNPSVARGPWLASGLNGAETARVPA